MKTFRNEFGEGRVVPHIGYHLVEDGETVLVPDDEAHHWIAGGWVLVDDTPAAPAAPTTPAVAPATPAKTATVPPEGTTQ